MDTLSITDCRQRVASGTAGIALLLECVAVALAESDFDLASAALAPALDRPSSHPELCRRTADLYATFSVATATSIEDFVERLRAIEGKLEELLDVAGPPTADTSAEGIRLAAHMAAAGRPIDLASLCAVMRNHQRSDLGVEATDRAIAAGHTDQRLLTTRGAALADLGRLDESVDTLNRAWSLAPSVYVANALTRACMLSEDFLTAEQWARQSLALEVSISAAAQLYAIAGFTGDLDLRDEARELMVTATPSTKSGDARWFVVKEVEALLHGGKVSRAWERYRTIESPHSYYPAASVYHRLVSAGDRCVAQGCRDSRRRGFAYCESHSPSGRPTDGDRK